MRKTLFYLGAGVLALLVTMYWPKKTVPVHIPAPTIEYVSIVEEIPAPQEIVEVPEEPMVSASEDIDLPPDVDRMTQLFEPYPPLLPIVETVSYTTRVPWLEGRSAYLGDYASHYHTSKHFISRSLKGMGDYFSTAVSKGDRFNVLRTDKEIEFHLVLDLSRTKLWVYAYDATDNQRILLKAYRVCCGKLDEQRSSGSHTPTGVFKLGEEIAVYQEGVMGTFRGEPTEMVSVFGKRWIPFEREVANCSGSCRGLGIHGTPFKKDFTTDAYQENRTCIGHYESSGCLRLLTEDIEEIFAVIVSRPSYIHIVKDFQQAQLPGKEFL